MATRTAEKLVIGELRSAILSGTLPTVAFSDLRALEPSLTNHDLADRFFDDFPDIDMEAVHAIWNWAGINKQRGLTDDVLNRVLLELARRAGYQVASKDAV